MPNYNRYVRRRTKPYRRAARAAYSDGQRALAMAKAIKAVINVERKVHAVGNTTDISTTPNVFLLTGIAQGDDVSDREGRSIKPMFLDYRFTMEKQTGIFDFVRFLIVRDKDSTGVAPTITDILTTSDVRSHRNRVTDQNRIEILVDRVFSLSGSSAATDSTTSSMHQYVQGHVKLSKHLKYDGTGATDVSWGAIHAVFLGVQAAGGAATDMDWNSQLVFIDN